MGKAMTANDDPVDRIAINWSRVGDIGLSALFLTFAATRIFAANRAVGDRDWLLVAHHLVVAGYMTTVAGLPLIRRKPVARSQDLLSKLAATVATYFVFFPLSLLPLTWRPDWLLTISTVGLTMVALVEIWALLTLRRSFSVFAEARNLVTTGPYGIVRHPLYSLYILSYAFVVLPRLSVLAVAIALFGIAAQMIRARREEKVLRSVFREYDVYAARVPRFVPRVRRWPAAPALAAPTDADRPEERDEALAA